MSTFKLKKADGTLVDLRQYAEIDPKTGSPAVQLGPRRREYNLQYRQGVQGDAWGTAGDGHERATLASITVELKRGETRAWQRQAIEELHALCLQTVAWQNLHDQREYAVNQARVTDETPDESLHTYFITIVFWEKGGAALLGDAVIILPPGDGDGIPQWGNLWT